MKILSLFLMLWGLSAQAQVSVAFFEMYDADGKLVQLEPGGRFFHVAISYKGGWIHSFPGRGTEFMEDLSLLGRPALVLTKQSAPALTAAEVEPLLGQPFDFQYNWEDPNSSYCSKLALKLLGYPPLPADFSGERWEHSSVYRTQKLGASPDDVFHILTREGYVPGENPILCKGLFMGRGILQPGVLSLKGASTTLMKDFTPAAVGFQ